jgi:hypothetical protein
MSNSSVVDRCVRYRRTDALNATCVHRLADAGRRRRRDEHPFGIAVHACASRRVDHAREQRLKSDAAEIPDGHDGNHRA